MKFIRFKNVMDGKRYLVSYPPKNLSQWIGLMMRGFRKNHYTYWHKEY